MLLFLGWRHLDAWVRENVRTVILGLYGNWQQPRVLLLAHRSLVVYAQHVLHNVNEAQWLHELHFNQLRQQLRRVVLVARHVLAGGGVVLDVPGLREDLVVARFVGVELEIHVVVPHVEGDGQQDTALAGNVRRVLGRRDGTVSGGVGAKPVGRVRDPVHAREVALRVLEERQHVAVEEERRARDERGPHDGADGLARGREHEQRVDVTDLSHDEDEGVNG